MLKFKPRLLQREQQGFTLTEVLVSILIVSVFVLVSMQAMVFAAYFKVRAKQYAEATTWIQENLESVKQQADQYGDSTKCNATRIQDGYAQGLLNDLSRTDVPRPPSTERSTPADEAERRALIEKQPHNTLAIKPHFLTRTAVVRDVAPYEVLQIAYSVAPASAHTTLTSAASATSTSLSVASASGFKVGDQLTVGTDTTNNSIQSISGNTVRLNASLGSDQPVGRVVDASVATMYTEVVPDAAFQCQ